MSKNALIHTPSADGTTNRRPDLRVAQPAPGAERTESSASMWRGLLGLLSLGIALAAAAAALGTRTWQVGTGLGSALFPVEDIVELAAVAVGAVVAGWTGLHALLALTCVLAERRGLHWSAGERTVARHAPAVVRRLARAAAGAGVGLALAIPTATALPAAPEAPAETRGAASTSRDEGGSTGAAASADAGPAVVLDLGWQPTEREATGDGRSERGSSDRRAFDRTSSDRTAHDRSDPSRPGPTPERSSLVNRGQRTGMRRDPLVVVEPGDTLWAIAADQLADELTGKPTGERSATGRRTAEGGAGSALGSADDGPSDAEIAAAVAQWHDANRQVLGTDPDLIRPGMVLYRP